ncbi:MAG: hypothetical protein ACHQTF_02240 [Gemmatimonadales bacterium]
MAGAAACGKAYAPALSLDTVPLAVPCAPAKAPAAPMAVTIAGAPESPGVSDPASVVQRLLSQIGAAGAAPACVGPGPAERGGMANAGQDTVVVRRVSDRGARDALDQGADIMVTRDRSVVAYAAGNPGLVSVPLQWDRVYVLVMRRQPGQPDSAAIPLGAALASDVVHADARAFAAGMVLPDTVCGGDATHPSVAAAPLPASGRMPGAARILYDQDDSVARFLAERVAVLASTGSSLLAGVAPALSPMSAEMYATGLPARELPRALMDARSTAYIVAIPLPAAPSCGETGAFPASGPRMTMQSGDRQAAIVPLIETRAWAIVRRDAIPHIAALGGRGVVAEERAP